MENPKVASRDCNVSLHRQQLIIVVAMQHEDVRLVVLTSKTLYLFQLGTECTSTIEKLIRLRIIDHSVVDELKVKLQGLDHR